MTNPSLGILGSGHLASYTVAGLRNAGDDRKVFLSPRNYDVAKELSKNYNCTIAADNQSVIKESDIILLAVRPNQLDDLLECLAFNPEQIIVSAMAGVTIDHIKSYPNLSANTVVRTLPSVSAEVNSGPIPLLPDNKTARELLNNLGTIIVLDNESLFDIATVHACMHGWIYFWLDTIINWTTAQGIEQKQAEIMIKQTIQGAIDFSNRESNSLNEIGDSIATEGTYTLAGPQQLKANQSLQDWPDAMQLVLDKLSS